MTAYNFKPMFAPKILDGTKRQTIRAVGKRRHARPGEQLQLYTGMRTRQCRLIARATCEAVSPITLFLAQDEVVVEHFKWKFSRRDLDAFARRDGFDNWKAMRQFWREEHGDIEQFDGVLITWRPIGDQHGI